MEKLIKMKTFRVRKKSVSSKYLILVSRVQYSTVINRTLPSVDRGSLETTLTVPLRKSDDKPYIFALIFNNQKNKLTSIIIHHFTFKVRKIILGNRVLALYKEATDFIGYNINLFISETFLRQKNHIYTKSIQQN